MASEFIRQTRMEKIIKINGVDVKFRADASTPRMYRVMFSRDAFRDMSDLMECYSKSGRLPENGLETLENIAYCMAKQADPEVPSGSSLPENSESGWPGSPPRTSADSCQRT